jgi:hypothetical protein
MTVDIAAQLRAHARYSYMPAALRIACGAGANEIERLRLLAAEPAGELLGEPQGDSGTNKNLQPQEEPPC